MLYIVIIILGILLDQLSKYLILVNFELFQQIPILGDWISLTYVRNYGLAFSLFEHNRWIFVTFISICVIGASIFLYKYSSTKPKLFNIGLAFIISGGIGNLIDRIFRGYVVDFIYFKNFPVFNVADSLIVLGVIAVWIMVFVSESKRKKMSEIQ